MWCKYLCLQPGGVWRTPSPYIKMHYLHVYCAKSEALWVGHCNDKAGLPGGPEWAKTEGVRCFGGHWGLSEKKLGGSEGVYFCCKVWCSSLKEAHIPSHTIQDVTFIIHWLTQSKANHRCQPVGLTTHTWTAKNKWLNVMWLHWSCTVLFVKTEKARSKSQANSSWWTINSLHVDTWEGQIIVNMEALTTDLELKMTVSQSLLVTHYCISLYLSCICHRKTAVIIKDPAWNRTCKWFARSLPSKLRWQRYLPVATNLIIIKLYGLGS